MNSAVFDEAPLQLLLEKIAKDRGFTEPIFAISSGSKPGANYVCSIYRVVITDDGTHERPLSLIVKVSIPKKCSKSNAVFQELNRIEAGMYQVVLPALNNVLKKHDLSKSDIFPGTARFYAFHGSDSSQALFMEDKSTDGFQMLGEAKKLDLDHCRHVLEKIALLHAASIALRRQEPEQFEIIKTHLLKEGAYKEFFNPITEQTQAATRAGLKLLPDSFKEEDAFKRVEKAAENYIEEIAAANEVPPDFPCILHGDCWFNNVLYKYDQDNLLEDVCLIDFQLSRLASPAAELSYMLYTSTTKEMRDESYDDIMRIYHDQLSSFLRKMKCDSDVVTLQVLKQHMKKYGQVGPLTALSGMSVALMDSTEGDIPFKSSEHEESLFSARQKLPPDSERKKIMENRIISLVTDAYDRHLI